MTGSPRRSDGASRQSELSPFEFRTIPELSLAARLFWGESPDAAAAKLESMLANSHPVELSVRHVARIDEEYRLARTTAARVHRELFAKAYRAFAADDRLSDAEVTYLDELRRLLTIGDDDLIALERETIVPRYDRAVAHAIQNGVTLDERAALDRLASDLRASPAIRKELEAKPESKLLNKALAERLTGRRLTPEDFDSFVEVARNIGIHPSFDNATTESMYRCALLWRIESGEFPVIRASVQLHDDELCHFVAPARWLEARGRTYASTQYGPDAGVRIARGLAYHAGTTRPRRLTVDELAEVDTGTLYVTSQRVIFQGTDHAFSQTLDALHSVDVFADGIAIERDAGRHPHLVLDDNAEAAAALLIALLRETPRLRSFDNSASRSTEARGR